MATNEKKFVVIVNGTRVPVMSYSELSLDYNSKNALKERSNKGLPSAGIPDKDFKEEVDKQAKDAKKNPTYLSDSMRLFGKEEEGGVPVEQPVLVNFLSKEFESRIARQERLKKIQEEYKKARKEYKDKLKKENEAKKKKEEAAKKKEEEKKKKEEAKKKKAKEKKKKAEEKKKKAEAKKNSPRNGRRKAAGKKTKNTRTRGAASLSRKKIRSVNTENINDDIYPRMLPEIPDGPGAPYMRYPNCKPRGLIGFNRGDA